VLPNVSIKVKKKKKLHLCIVQQYIYLTEQTNKQKKLPHFHFLQRTRLKFSVVHTFFYGLQGYVTILWHLSVSLMRIAFHLQIQMVGLWLNHTWLMSTDTFTRI